MFHCAMCSSNSCLYTRNTSLKTCVHCTLVRFIMQLCEIKCSLTRPLLPRKDLWEQHNCRESKEINARPSRRHRKVSCERDHLHRVFCGNNNGLFLWWKYCSTCFAGSSFSSSPGLCAVNLQLEPEEQQTVVSTLSKFLQLANDKGWMCIQSSDVELLCSALTLLDETFISWWLHLLEGASVFQVIRWVLPALTTNWTIIFYFTLQVCLKRFLHTTNSLWHVTL